MGGAVGARPASLGRRRRSEGRRIVDFRYHLVSIIAVFLAIAMGIVLGTTQLNGAILDNLRGNITQLSRDKSALQGSVQTLRGEVDAGQQTARVLGPSIVAGSLTGQRVVLVTAPDASPRLRDDLLPLLAAAGAVNVGTVRLRPTLLDPLKIPLLQDVVAQNPVPGLELGGQPVDRAVSLLAAVLVRGRQPAVTPATRQRVLTAYADKDIIDLDGIPEPATLAVLLVGPAPAPPPSDQQAAQETAAATVRTLLNLARRLDVDSAGAVVAGPLEATLSGGVLQALRDDVTLSESVSSVDGADTPRGRIAAVLALREQLTSRAGRYGTGQGADAPVPSPLPPLGATSQLGATSPLASPRR